MVALGALPSGFYGQHFQWVSKCLSRIRILSSIPDVPVIETSRAGEGFGGKLCPLLQAIAVSLATVSGLLFGPGKKKKKTMLDHEISELPITNRVLSDHHALNRTMGSSILSLSGSRVYEIRLD